ncbi:hypothetical protein [Lyngbya confervoides]|uniref:Uncharacterized protein n=1 Tax=Lyngbya confervoides BDU141951 TaxID=1574623 RepID=A0ABD4SY73_9CYAN|nr:hypothetical protein [Lyngbya confervoides]MCM1981284.1 hypothetical protein [Lyngbya confervoides BDU141951]
MLHSTYIYELLRIKTLNPIEMSKPGMRKSLSSLIPQKTSDSGFALPTVIGMGLIVLLVALTAVLRAQDDRTVSQSKQETSRSQLAAEAGVTKIQAFMNRYRSMAKYNACNGDDWASDGSCNNTGTTAADASWGNPNLIPHLNASCGTGTLADSRTALSNWTTTSWQLVDSADPAKGEYRLLRYESNGTLTVEGAVMRGEPGESFSTVTVRIPVFDILNEQVAGLWVQNTISGNPRMDSDVVGPCTGSLTASPLNGKAIIRSQLTMPPAPSIPAKVDHDSNPSTPDVYPTGVYEFSSINSGVPGTNSGSAIGKKLPRLISNNNGATADDQPDSLGIYNYIINSIDDSFEIVPGKAVNIWVTGDINLENKILVNPCNDPGAALTCGPFDIRIYGTGSALTLNEATVVCDVFFHLPGYAASFTSGGTAERDCGSGQKSTGVYWLNSWSGADGTNSVTSPRATWKGALDATSISVPPPRIGPVQRWEPES